MKHAEMEYEDQIEKEVISEAMQQKEDEEDAAALEGNALADDENILSMSLEGLEDGGPVSFNFFKSKV